MAMTAEQRTAIIKAVVGMFGAAPGATYLNELSPYAGNTTQLIHDLTTTTAFKTLYPTFLTNQEFATKFLNNLLGSAVTDADAKAWAINWMTSMLNTGASRGQVIAEALAALDAISSNDAVWGKAAQQFDNKVTVAEYYTVTMGATSTDLTTLQGVVANVTNTTDVSTPEKIEQIIDETPGGATGQTFMLTFGIDNLPGTAGNDTYIGDAASASAADQINGGAGIDTLKLYGTTALPTTTGVEVIDIYGVSAGTLNVSGRADVTDVKFNDATVTGDYVVTVAAGQTISVNSVVGNAAGDFDINGAASVALAVNKVGTGTALDVDLLTAATATLDVDSSGAASSITLANTGGGLKTLNVSGDAALTISGNVPGATTITSTNTAGLTASTAVATAAGLAITTGAGKDTITLAQAAAASALSSKVAVDLGAGDDTLVISNLNAATNIQAGASFKGGEGTDTLNVVNGALLDATTGKQFSGFEVLGLNGSSGTFDAGVLASTNTIGSVVVGAALGGNVTINNLAEGATVVFNASTGANTLTVNQKDAGAGSPDDVINATIDGKAAITVADVDFNDIETVNVSATSVGTNITHIASVLAADEATKITVDASTAGLTIGDLEADSLVLFDASASAKAVSVTTGADTFNANSGVAFKLGAGDDVLDLTGANTKAAAGALDFVITGGAGADTITLAVARTGVDHVVYLAQTDSTAAKFDSVTNFTTAEDKIDLKAFGFTGAADDALLAKTTGVSINAVTGAVEVTDAVAGNFFNDAGIDRAVAVWDAGADVYVFVDVNKDGDFSADGDLVIKLTGGADGAGAVPVIGDFIFA